MSTREIIDELDRCKTALQVVAEMQSDGLATLARSPARVPR
jgi:hypothetical protein